MPCGSCGQRARLKPSGRVERVLRELPRARACRLGQDGRQQMRVARAVVHLRPGRAQERPVQRELHPVAAQHPRTVVPVARRLQARAHRQQIFDGDGALDGVLRLRQFREVGDDRRLDAGYEAALDGDADQCRDDALRGGLDVGRTRRARAVVIALEDGRAAPVHQQAVQPRQFAGELERRREVWGRGRLCLPTRVDLAHQQRQHDRGNQGRRPQSDDGGTSHRLRDFNRKGCRVRRRWVRARRKPRPPSFSRRDRRGQRCAEK